MDMRMNINLCTHMYKYKCNHTQIDIDRQTDMLHTYLIWFYFHGDLDPV